MRITEQEASEIVENFPTWNLEDQWLEVHKMELLTKVIIDALKEIQKYHEIGTVDECREAVEKQKPKTPEIEGDGYADDGQMLFDTWICPNCGKRYEIGYDDYKYCPWCGQNIEKAWEE